MSRCIYWIFAWFLYNLWFFLTFNKFVHNLFSTMRYYHNVVFHICNVVYIYNKHLGIISILFLKHTRLPHTNIHKLLVQIWISIFNSRKISKIFRFFIEQTKDKVVNRQQVVRPIVIKVHLLLFLLLSYLKSLSEITFMDTFLKNNLITLFALRINKKRKSLHTFLLTPRKYCIIEGKKKKQQQQQQQRIV